MKSSFVADLLIICACTAPKESSLEKISEITVAAEKTNGIIVLAPSNRTPRHRDNFIQLVRQGAYDSLLFHQVIN